MSLLKSSFDRTQSGNGDALDSQQNVNRLALSTALGQAIAQGREDLVESLLRSGADPNGIPPGGFWSAMHMAVEHKRCSTLAMLVEHGGNVNLKDESGFTPLHLAVDLEADAASCRGEKPTSDLTALLLSLGADPRLRDNKGRTAIDLAEWYGHEGAVRLLREKVQGI